jgi:N-acetylglucosaminyl-diphospho-decaprenol L-rhamnosyltransferase
MSQATNHGDNQQKLTAGDPKVSFVTVCYRTPHLIRLLLKGVEDADFAFDHEYFLVDNSPGDGTGDMVKSRYPWVEVIDTPRNVGFGAGNNHALRRARGEYIMLVNPDLVIFPGEMEKLVTFLDEHPDVGFAGPMLLHPDGAMQYSCYRFPGPLIPIYRRSLLGRTPWGKRAVDHYLMKELVKQNRAMEVDALMGSAILIRRKALEEIGMFDEKYFMYFEEVDICRRAWHYNWRVAYVPHVKMVHYHARESVVSWPWQIFTHKLARAHIGSALYYFWKYRNAKHPHTEIRPVL